MKIYNNVLTDETIQKIRNETNQTRGDCVWRSSVLSWVGEIQRGILASVACKDVSPELAESIESQIKHLLPPHDELYQQIYVWPRASGISAHNDGNKKFGATIYLNHDWELDFGGLFVWKEKETEELKVRMPEYNSMVLNDDEELHLVTPVAFNCMALRHTVQIWGM
jgi:hypothetical protein